MAPGNDTAVARGIVLGQHARGLARDKGGLQQALRQATPLERAKHSRDWAKHYGR